MGITLGHMNLGADFCSTFANGCMRLFLPYYHKVKGQSLIPWLQSVYALIPTGKANHNKRHLYTLRHTVNILSEGHLFFLSTLCAFLQRVVFKTQIATYSTQNPIATVPAVQYHRRARTISTSLSVDIIIHRHHRPSSIVVPTHNEPPDAEGKHGMDAPPNSRRSHLATS